MIAFDSTPGFRYYETIRTSLRTLSRVNSMIGDSNMNLNFVSATAEVAGGTNLAAIKATGNMQGHSTSEVHPQSAGTRGQSEIPSLGV